MLSPSVSARTRGVSHSITIATCGVTGNGPQMSPRTVLVSLNAGHHAATACILSFCGVPAFSETLSQTPWSSDCGSQEG